MVAELQFQDVDPGSAGVVCQVGAVEVCRFNATDAQYEGRGCWFFLPAHSTCVPRAGALTFCTWRVATFVALFSAA